jgi:hypothetical protein
MDDAQRFRTNAADCILAAERSGPAYRDLTFAIAESWLSLARQQEAMDGLLAIWNEARSTTATAIQPPIQYPLEPSRGRITAVRVREAVSA